MLESFQGCYKVFARFFFYRVSHQASRKICNIIFLCIELQMDECLRCDMQTNKLGFAITASSQETDEVPKPSPNRAGGRQPDNCAIRFYVQATTNYRGQSVSRRELMNISSL